MHSISWLHFNNNVLWMYSFVSHYICMYLCMCVCEYIYYYHNMICKMYLQAMMTLHINFIQAIDFNLCIQNCQMKNISKTLHVLRKILFFAIIVVYSTYAFLCNPINHNYCCSSSNCHRMWMKLYKSTKIGSVLSINQALVQHSSKVNELCMRTYCNF